jgi:hypothetical protein
MVVTIMEVFITKKYLAMLGLLEFLIILSYMWGWETWITVALVGFALIYLGHEWVHVVTAMANGVEIKYLVFEARGDCSAWFYPATPEKEAEIYLTGAGWDIFITVGIVAVAISSALFTLNPFPFIFGIVMLASLAISLNAPECDWQEYLKRTKKADA